MEGSSAVGAGTPVSDSPDDGSDEVVLLVSSVSCAAGINLRFFIAFATASATTRPEGVVLGFEGVSCALLESIWHRPDVREGLRAVRLEPIF